MFKQMNIKKLVLWLLVIMFGSFALAAVLQFITAGAEGFTKKGFLQNNKHARVIDEIREVELAGLENLDVSGTSTDITIITTNNSTIKAHLHGQIVSTNKDYFPTLEAEKNGKNAQIKVTWPKVITVGYLNTEMQLDLYLPLSYQQNLSMEVSSATIRFEELTLKNFNCTSTSGDMTGKLAITENTVLKTSSGRFNVSIQAQNDFRMESTSGDFKADRVEAKRFIRNTSSGATNVQSLNCTDFSYESTSGDLKVQEIHTVHSKIDTSSGRMELAGESTEKAALKSTSGDISWSGVNAKQTRVDTSSGRIILSGLTGSFNMEATSGDADLQFDRLEGPAMVTTSSGRIHLKLPENADFALDCTTSSGQIQLKDFQLMVEGKVSEDNLKGTVGNGANKIVLKSNSGDIILSKN